MFKETTRSLRLYGTLKNSAWDYWFQKCRHLRTSKETTFSTCTLHAGKWNNSCITIIIIHSRASTRAYSESVFFPFFPLWTFSHSIAIGWPPPKMLYLIQQGFVWYIFGELSGNLYLCLASSAGLSMGFSLFLTTRFLSEMPAEEANLCPGKPMVMPLGYTPKIPCALTTSYLVSQVIFIMTSSTSVTAGTISFPEPAILGKETKALG